MLLGESSDRRVKLKKTNISPTEIEVRGGHGDVEERRLGDGSGEKEKRTENFCVGRLSHACSGLYWRQLPAKSPLSICGCCAGGIPDRTGYVSNRMNVPLTQFRGSDRHYRHLDVYTVHEISYYHRGMQNSVERQYRLNIQYEGRIER